RRTINARLYCTCRGVAAPWRPPFPLRIPVRELSHARPTRHRPNRAVDLDSPDRLGVGLGWCVVDCRLASAGVPGGDDRIFVLGGGRQVSAALLPGDGAGRGRVGHDGLALYHSVPFRPGTLS